MTTRAPIASPSHQWRHAPANSAHVRTPAEQKLSVPMVALTAVLAMAASTTRPSTSRSRPIELSNATTRRSRNAPASASRVFPAATPAAAAGGATVERLTRKAPSATPGHRRYPKRRRAASAIPVGAQTSETPRKYA